MPALGLTDHGVMNGAVEHYKACKEVGIKPIIGVEAYLVDDREAVKSQARYERNHLTLMAHDDTGFRNLVMLSSAGFLEGFSRGKPNLDMELLSRHSEGVIALTGCLQSRFCRRLVEDRPADARAHADDLLQVFGPDQVYFELQRNGIPEQDKANEGIVKVARELGRPLVGTADVHYLHREDYENHAALLCVQTKSTVAEPKLSFDTNEFFLKSADEMTSRLRAVAGGRPEHARDRRSLRGRDEARQPAPAALRHRRRLRAGGDASPPLRRGDARPLRRPAPGRGGRAPRLRARRDQGDGLRVVLPDRLGLRPLREGERRRRGARPRLGGRLDRLLRARHHRHRPDRQRPAVRALPQPRPQVDAGHRHRLLGARPRARDPLRAGEVRPRARRADHHLRQDGAAGRDARRGPRARLRLRHG